MPSAEVPRLRDPLYDKHTQHPAPSAATGQPPSTAQHAQRHPARPIERPTPSAAIAHPPFLSTLISSDCLVDASRHHLQATSRINPTLPPFSWANGGRALVYSPRPWRNGKRLPSKCFLFLPTEVSLFMLNLYVCAKFVVSQQSQA